MIETQTNNLAWLATFQPWMPPYDLSGTPKLSNIWIPGLTTVCAEFLGREIQQGLFEYAQLPSASFSQSEITMEADAAKLRRQGLQLVRHHKLVPAMASRRAAPDWASIRWNEFTGAELKLAQFREATNHHHLVRQGGSLSRRVRSRAAVRREFQQCGSVERFVLGRHHRRPHLWLAPKDRMVDRGGMEFGRLQEAASAAKRGSTRPATSVRLSADRTRRMAGPCVTRCGHPTASIPTSKFPSRKPAPAHSAAPWRSTTWPGRWRPGESRARN